MIVQKPHATPTIIDVVHITSPMSHQTDKLKCGSGYDKTYQIVVFVV